MAPSEFELAQKRLSSDASLMTINRRTGVIAMFSFSLMAIIRFLFLLQLITNATRHPGWAISLTTTCTCLDIVLLIHIVYTCIKASDRTAYIADCILVIISLCMPAFHISRVVLLKGKTDWMSMTVFFGIGATNVDQPGPHLFVGWLLSTPVYLALDLYSQCYATASCSSAIPSLQQQCAPDQAMLICFMPASVATYLLKQGFRVAFGSLFVTVFTYLFKTRDRLQENQEKDQVSQWEPSSVPFSSFTWMPSIPGLDALSSGIDKATFWFAGNAEKGLMSFIVPSFFFCLVGYFGISSLAIRFGLLTAKSSFTPEEMLVSLSCCFVLSREVLKLDIAPMMELFGTVSKRYDRSRKMLEDMLPEHVVDSYLLSTRQLPEDLYKDDAMEGEVGIDAEDEQEKFDEAQPQDEKGEDEIQPRVTWDGLLRKASRQGSDSPSGLDRLKLQMARSSNENDCLSPTPSFRGMMHRPSIRNRSVLQLSTTLSQNISTDIFSKHECCTIFFSDLVGFSTWAHKVEPEIIMATLHDLYTRLDDVILKEMPMLYKIETIGDAYVVAANLIDPDPMHAVHMIRFALRAQQEACKVPRPDRINGECLQMRIGLHYGPVVSGVIGKIRKRFCLFGDAVNMTARTESSCPPGCVQLTEACYKEALPYLNDDEDIIVSDRGLVQVKGSDEPLHMYLASWMAYDSPDPQVTFDRDSIRMNSLPLPAWI